MPSPHRCCCSMRWMRADRAPVAVRMWSVWPRRLRVGALLVIGLALAACGPTRATRVVIPRGAFRAASDSLEAAGVVRFAPVFRVYARWRGLDRSIKAGTYVFPAGASWTDILQAMAEGRGLEKAVTIPEGLPLAKALPLVAQHLELPLDSLMAATRDSELVARVGAPNGTLEGYLFPDTYRFPFDATGRIVVEQMLERFEKAWTPAMEARLDSTGMTRHEVLTLASIVEEEAVVDSERPVIAGVYRNRLRRKMPLQADPTIRFALGKYRDRVLFRDLKVNSPYNTYVRPGLPPGPIAAPGQRSLEAALWPANVPWLFFVAHPDGHHEFTRTFAEHSAAIRRVRAEAARRAAAARDSAAAPASPAAADSATRTLGPA